MSGGAQWNLLGANVALVSSAPFDDRDRNKARDDGWVATGHNGSLNDKTLTVHAVCGKGVKLSYRSKKVKVPTGSAPLGVALNCKSRKQRPVGGGAILGSTHPSVRLRGSIPHDIFDSVADPDGEPDDGWRVAANNASGQTVKMRVFTICEAKGTYRYEFQGVAFGATGAVSFEPGCDPGEVSLNGGGEISLPGDPALYLQESYPIPNGIHVSARNDGSPGADFVTYTICRT